MRRMILVSGMGAALAVAVIAGQASAGIREYCDSYARDVAHRKTNGGADVGTGSVGGTILGAGVTSNPYKRAYANAFERCLNNYEGQRASPATAETKVTENKVTENKAVVSKVTETKVAENEAVEKDKASPGSWTEACARKYRSWDAQKGKYKSYTGKWRPCRL